MRGQLMIVLTQYDEACINLEYFESIEAYEDGTVILTMNTSTEYQLGKYKNQDRAKEVVGEMFSLLGSSSRYNMPIV